MEREICVVVEEKEGEPIKKGIMPVRKGTSQEGTSQEEILCHSAYSIHYVILYEPSPKSFTIRWFII